MNKDQQIAQLEAVLAQFLQPVRGVPLPLVIKALGEHEVLRIDRSGADEKLVGNLIAAARGAGAAVKAAPIIRPRPNEVGNDIEPFVKAALTVEGLRVERPTDRAGRAKQTGYPDILCFDQHDRPTYIECKSFEHGKPLTTMRSFYLSPSGSFKVCHDARHVVMAFGMLAKAIPDSRNSSYIPVSYKIIDLADLLCDVKYEFNASNKSLYAGQLVVASGQIP